MTEERYQAMRRAASSLDWRFEVALILAHETGHRIGAIRQLRWSDVDLERGQIKWRAEADKIAYAHQTPLTQEAMSALERAREANPSIGEACVLPSPTDHSKPCSRHLVRDWWSKAEKLAGLPRIRGLGWHSLRRKFATELKKVPLRDLCELGGWKSSQTLLTCYQRPDEETMRTALEQRRVLRAGSDR